MYKTGSRCVPRNLPRTLAKFSRRVSQIKPKSSPIDRLRDKVGHTCTTLGKSGLLSFHGPHSRHPTTVAEASDKSTDRPTDRYDAITATSAFLAGPAQGLLARTPTDTEGHVGRCSACALLKTEPVWTFLPRTPAHTSSRSTNTLRSTFPTHPTFEAYSAGHRFQHATISMLRPQLNAN